MTGIRSGNIFLGPLKVNAARAKRSWF